MVWNETCSASSSRAALAHASSVSRGLLVTPMNDAPVTRDMCSVGRRCPSEVQAVVAGAKAA